MSIPIASNRSERWLLAARLIEEWFGPGTQLRSTGHSRTDIRAAEQRLGLALPEALAEWYVKLEARRDVWGVQDRPVLPQELRIVDGRLVVLRENQATVEWAIESQTLASADPAVLVSDPSHGNFWLIEAPTLSEFALQRLFLNLKFSSIGLSRANGALTEKADAAVQRHLPRIALSDLQWPSFPTRFYGNESVVVELDAHKWIWVSARDPEAFTHVTQMVEKAGVVWESIENGS